MQCLDDNVASEFVSGTMAATAVSRVEGHLASCRDCRALVAALAGDETDSNARTRPHERLSEDSQVTKRPVLSIGDRVGRYLVLATLGAGGMGVVFTAYDPQLDRKVALKLLRTNLGANTNEARTRLKREAQAIAQLNHPNVVGVYDVGTTPDGDVYIAMEFVEGDTLTTWLKKWPRTWREILDVFHQAGRGLMAAHGVGLLHRDFKPDNVLVGADGRVRVTDFGLARSVFLDDSARGPTTATPAEGSPLQVDLTATGTVLGTPRYMPPEQLTGPTIDARADQFSFCVALYEALYGTHPLEGGTSVSMLEKGLPANAPPEKTLVPAPIGRAVMRGLDKERHKRFPTMATLMQELTPPQQRSSAKFVAFAAVGALAVTAATAAVISLRKPDAHILVPTDDGPVIENLMREIKRRDKEIAQLRIEIQKRELDAARLGQIQKELDEKTEEVKFLTDQLIVEKARKTPNATPIVAKITGEQISTSIQNATVMHDLAFCFNEITLGGTQKAPRADKIDAVVRLTTKPSGAILDGSVSTAGLDFSPTTQLCVQSVLERVAYPKGSELTDVRVTLAWDTGNLVVAANVVGQREPTGSNLDGI